MSFKKMFFSSCLGTIFGTISLVGIVLGLSLLVRSCSGGESVQANTLLRLSFDKELPELDNNMAQNASSGDFKSLFDEALGLHSTIALIEHAAKDPNIKGIVFDIQSASGGYGLATLKKLHGALMSFRESGKFILAHGTIINQKAYYLASAADKIYLHPQGGMDFRGFSAQYTYFKGALDKLGVKAQVFYAGKFKSATEPFRRTDMSDENRLQVREYIESLYDFYLQTIADARSIDKAELRRIADNYMVRNAKDAERLKMVDGLLYKDEFLAELRERLGLGEKDALTSISLNKYKSLAPDALKSKGSATQRIAVVVAEGSIVDGEGEQGSIGGDRYARELRKLRQDESVKAIVLRINSGGGSALASDIIWRELVLAREQGIAVVASMGDVAASGGYYIAAPAQKIFAENNSLTGSIGVFGLIPNWRELMEDKMGLTMDTVKTGRFSAFDPSFYGFNEEEAEIIQQGVDEIYTVFKSKVSQGRDMSMEAVDEIAQGRVWTGAKAKEIGLVDELGGLQEAIEEAAKLANLSDYRPSYYPKTKSFWDQLFDSDSEKKDKLTSIEKQLEQRGQGQIQKQLPAALHNALEAAQQVQDMQGVQMRLPFVLDIR